MRIPPLFALKTNYVKSFFLFLFVKIQTKKVNLKSSNEKDFNLNWSLRREKMVRKATRLSYYHHTSPPSILTRPT